MSYLAADIRTFSELPMNFPASQIALPTEGFTVESIDTVAGNKAAEGELDQTGRGDRELQKDSAKEPAFIGNTYYMVRGAIHPIDPSAPDIHFQVNLPAMWNQTAVHYGGAGFDGTVETAVGPCAGENYGGPGPVTRGYVTFGSDGGHRGRPGDNWDASFGLNDEALRNFASECLKKTKDASLAIVRKVYGASPRRVYFAGASNGGREALRAIHDYPEDYDGAVIQYPVLNWVGKSILDNRNTNFICADPKRWISREDFAKVHQIIRAHLDRKNTYGTTVPMPFPSGAEKDTMIREIGTVLTAEQMEALLLYSTPITLPFELANGIREIPGYGLLDGAVLCDRYFNQFSEAPCRRDGFMSQFSDGVIRDHVMRDASYDPSSFDYTACEEQIRKASALLDATSADFDRFAERGGKIILLHGTGDQLVTMYSTIDLVKRMQTRYGERLDDFLRFYLVPGYGHGVGEEFTFCRDLLPDLEGWRDGGTAPEALEITNQTPQRESERQTLQPVRFSSSRG